jgi:hypothetical protein
VAALPGSWLRHRVSGCGMLGRPAAGLRLRRTSLRG